MNLQETLRNNTTYCKNPEEKVAMKTVLGEFDRVNDGKPVDDDIAIKKLKALKKSEEELLKYQNKSTSVFLQVVEDYLKLFAVEISEEDIRLAISEIDFSQFKNKMQAMSIIMKKFGSNVDGNLVKKILMES